MGTHGYKTAFKPRLSSTGLWLVILIPIILNGFCAKHPMKVSSSYQNAAMLALNISLSAICWFCLTLLLDIPGSNMGMLYKENRTLTHIAIMLSIFCIVTILKNESWLGSSTLVIATHVSFVALCKYIMLKASSSFTLGEVFTISQGIVMFSIVSTIKLLKDIKSSPVNEAERLTSILQITFLGLEISILLFIIFPPLRKMSGFLLILTSFVLFEFISLFNILQINAITWIVNFTFSFPKRVTLFFYWVSLCVLTILLTIWHKSNQSGSITVKRKYFHVLISAVYIPGIIYDIQLLYLCSSVVLCLLITVECCRLLHLQPLDFYINQLFLGYVDEKDKGILILSPIYLLVGCTFPLWLWYGQLDAEDLQNQRTLFLLSGVLSIGVGDAAAAVGGTKFGKQKWPGTNKTYIGTMCCIAAQLAVISLLYLGWLQWAYIDVQKCCVAILITSLAEAWTSQVDNLALPLIMMSILTVSL